MPRTATTFRRRIVPVLALLAALAPAARASTALEAVPPLTAAQRPADIASDPADLSGYLAHWKAVGLARSRANATAGTVNQSQYDVRTYDLDLAPNVATKVLTGTVRMIATVVQGPLTSVDLDMDTGNLSCDAALSSGSPVTFATSTGILTVNLDRPYLTGETIDVIVSYHGRPAAGAFGAAFTDSVYNGRYFVGTLSEPYDARTWWPCKDDPADKADSVDVRLTVPTTMITAGNGIRTQYVDNGTTSVTRWHERHPISTYLVSVASYPYTVYSDWYKYTATDSMEIRFHIVPENVPNVSPVQTKVKSMLAAFEARYGAYPFRDEKYGHAQFLWGGGMENQTCTSLGSFGEYTIAHELAHQWFGDHITCRNFHHIWLNEGFATFNEAIWAEANGGIAAFHSIMNAKVYTGAGTVYVPDTTNAGRIFDSGLTYRKGGWVVTMLRHVMGDGPFFAGMQAYLQQYGGSVATTEDFRHVMESVSGRDLTKFFQEWVYGEGVPAYRLGWGSVAAPGGGFDVTVQVQQTQAGQTFWMPVDVRINTGSGPFTFVANDSTTLDLFTFHVPVQPTSVQLDPDRWILRGSTIATVTGVDAAAGPALSLAAPHPNPAHGRTTLRFTLPAAGEADVTVVDATGRRVATVAHGAMGAGEHHLEWSARSDNGRALAPGLYWVRLTYGGRSATQRIALVE